MEFITPKIIYTGKYPAIWMSFPGILEIPGGSGNLVYV
jgi:hypothetical protein